MSLPQKNYGIKFNVKLNGEKPIKFAFKENGEQYMIGSQVTLFSGYFISSSL